MAEVICRVCSDILPPTKRRQIFSSAFQVSSQLSQVLCYNPQENDGLSSCICLACYSKLNRMCKIDFDLQHRLDQLRQEKTQIVSLLRSKMKFHPVKLQGASFKYPSGSVQEDCCTSGDIAASSPKDPGKRKSIARTPTPRKPKQAMLHTPRKHGKARLLFGDSSECSSIDLAQALPGDQEKTAADATIEPSKPTVPAATPCTPAGKSVMLKSTQSLFSPGHMRVQHRGKAGSIRSRVIRNSSSKSIVASICRGSSCDNIAKTIIKSDLKWNVTDALLRNLGTECKNLCSQAKPTLLQNVSPANLKAMRFDRIDAEFQIEAPILYKTLSCLTGGAETAIVTAGAVCLFARNPRMSLFQHAIGQVLDHSGATNEAIRTLNKLGISVSTPSVERQRKSLQQEQEKRVQEMFRSQDKDNACGSTSIGTSHSVEVIGDNIDITRNPSQMTKERKRKSWHWFLLLGVQKRVLFPDLPDEKPKADISQMDNATFVPSPSDCQNLEQNFMHHIMHVLVKFVPCLKDLKSCLPTHIEHPYQNETSQKTSYTVLDMLDKSENKTDEMITILEHIHENYIPHHGNPPSVIQKKVFGGDCLTNERAYAAQLALLNSPTDHTRLSGIIHRPEGLHRMMNLCLFLYQQFYKASSAGDAGTLYQLRNVLRRVNVQGPKEVVGSYRAHYSFIQDCLDGYVVAACMEIMGLDEIDSEPESEIPSLHNQALKYNFLKKLAMSILEKFVKLSDSLQDIQDETAALETESKVTEGRFDSEQKKYICQCGKTYKTKGYFERHLTSVHGRLKAQSGTSSKLKSEDCIAAWRASFMKGALLLRDTNDAYQMGDGTRIGRNAKFEMLLCDVGQHTKYRLWLFRFQAYIHAILTERQSMEYQWNCTSNTQGGLGRNIPNDNLVEMTVQAVKKKIHQQGANATYKSARCAALSMQMQNEIRDNLMISCKSKASGKKRPDVSKTSDIKVIVAELRKSKVFQHVPGRSFEGFQNFKDVFSRVKSEKLYTWLSHQKKRLSDELL